MSFVLTTPEMLAAAAGDLQGIGSAIAAANTVAASPTTGLLAPAGDSVSARTAAVFAAHAQGYQALSARAAAFHNQFVQTLIAGGNSYANTETSNAAAAHLTPFVASQQAANPARLVGQVGSGNPNIGNLSGGNIGNGNLGNRNIGIGLTGNNHAGFSGFNSGSGPGLQSANPAALASRAHSSNSVAGNLGSAKTGSVNSAAPTSTVTPASQTGTALIMGGTGNPQPNPGYVTAVDDLYIAPKYPGYTPVGLYTPEQFWPVTGLTSETFGKSVAQGVPLLNNAIMTQTAGGNHVVVVGYSQSATIATIEMRNLDALPASARPSPDQLSFVLLGDPNNPNGGILERFNGLYIPGLNVLFNGATPANTPYPTAIYTIEYDGIADFPQYPLDLPADANALLGYLYLHSTYPNLTAAQLATAVQEPVSPGYTGATTYYMIPTQNLPLLDPVRSIPYIGNPLADLLQPDLTTIVNLGYGNLNYGWSQGPANVPTPIGLFPNVPPAAIATALEQGTVEGIHDALAAAGLPPL
jgi:hypothetical protein